MDIIVSREQGRVPVTVIRLHGSLDASSYGQLEQAFREVHTAGAQHILLDLADAPYVSSAGIRTLSLMFRALLQSAGEAEDEALYQGVRDGTYRSPYLKLLAPNELVRNALKISGMDMLLDVYADLDGAVAAF